MVLHFMLQPLSEIQLQDINARLNDTRRMTVYGGLNDTQSSHSMSKHYSEKWTTLNFRRSFLIQTEHTRLCCKRKVMIITIDSLEQ